MIIAHEYPVCEYDTGRDPIIRPADFLKKSLPEKCVITFFRKELEEFVKEHSLPVIGHLHSEVLDIPIYTYESGQKRLCITMPFSTAPGAAGTIEELRAMGCDKFVICGAAGALTKGSAVGEIFLPASLSGTRERRFTIFRLPGKSPVMRPHWEKRRWRCPKWECRL